MITLPSAPSLLVRAACVLSLGALLAGCTGRGGGYLPPDGVMFAGQASLGFSFSCERSSRSTSLNPPTAQLRIEMAYVDQGANPLGASFGIHGTADVIDPVLESQVCIGQEPVAAGQPLIFLGRYRLTSSPPAGIPSSCALKQSTDSNCRFEVIVRDSDLDRAPSKGDFFSIKLSTVTDTSVSEFPVTTVFYVRAGLLGGGNLTVD